ncbi:MAG: FHA domain-containing protein [Bacteroidetes bacterium]|nr:FHA domain-containing protein [Bacteroidota bacterium]
MATRPTLLLIFVTILFCFVPAAQAQQGTGLDLRISQVSTLETPDGLVLKAYFNIFDPKTSLSVTGVQPQNAEITLPQYNYTVQVPVTRPDVPIYVTLVLDSSGSMGGLESDLKRAAKSALANTPDNSFFAVVQFDEEIKLLQDFTQNIPAVTYAIDQYTVKRQGGTCLYDATYSAIEALQKAPVGRRAVLVFTDGRDIKIDGKPCSKRNFNEVMNLAMDNQVPISTIGLSLKDGDLNEVELKGWASATGGISAIVRKDDLSSAFGNIMDALKSQWMVQAEVYPRRGTSQVLLTLNLSGSQSISKTFSIDSNTDYPGPPSKVRAQMDGFILNAANQAYDIQLSLTSPELVKYVKVEIWDKSAGSKVGDYSFENPQPRNVLQIPTSILTVSRGYYLVISAISMSDNTPFQIARLDDKPVKEIRHEFVFDPSSAFPTLQIQAISQKSFDLGVDFSLTNPALVAGIDGWLVNQETSIKVDGSDFRLMGQPGDNQPLIIPLRNSRVPSGKYTLILRVLANDGGIYSTDTYKDINYKAPTLIERLLSAVIANPAFLLAILAIVVGLVAFLMITSSKQKQFSGTPVIDDKLGKNLKAGSVLPISGDEPIPAQPANGSVKVRPVVPENASGPTVADLHNNVYETVDAVLPTLTLSFVEAPADVDRRPRLIKQFPSVIGRADGEVQIAEQHLSRRHAQVDYDPARGSYRLTDLGSRNGTYVDNLKLTPSQAVQLNPGSKVRLGTKIVLRIDIT